jgi:uncharacterized membrane protein
VREARALGALFGFFCYMTYDLTNYATLKAWSLKVTIFDMIWRTVLTGSALPLVTGSPRRLLAAEYKATCH